MSPSRFRLLLAALMAAYVLIETAYVVRQPLIMDEFAGAAEVHNLTHGVPYRDYTPYKTVAGYAIQAIAAAFAGDAWTRLIAIKLQMMAVNAAMLAVVGLWLQRLYGRRSALLALVVMVCSSMFLERSSELRVDMLTAWLGVLSLLALLDRKPAWGGLLLALSFAVSQKAALYAVAADAAFVLLFIIAPREQRRRHLQSFLLFNGVFAAGVLSYIVLWSIPSSMQAVVTQVFGTMADAAALDTYDIRWRYWSQTLIRNPAVFALAAIALWQLGRKAVRDRTAGTEAFLFVFSVVLLAQAVWYPTPWPYFFVIIWPTLLVLHAAAFETLRIPRAAYALLLVVAVIYPLLRLPLVLSRDNGYQRYTIELADALVGPRETYLAATPLLPHRRQSVERLAWVDAIAIAQLRRESPEALQGIVTQLERMPPKVLITSYRIYGLPPAFRIWFDEHYTQLAASVHTYAPRIAPGRATVPVAFAGRYRVELQQPDRTIRIDGRERRHGEMLELSRGTHTIGTATGVRLRHLPHGVERLLDARFLREQVFFPNLYDE